MGEQRTRQGRQQENPLQSERGATTIGDAVVAKIVGIAAQEVEGVQPGGGAARAMGGFLDRVPGAVSGVGGGSQTQRRLRGGWRGGGRRRALVGRGVR
jgi:hypothetical protein